MKLYLILCAYLYYNEYILNIPLLPRPLLFTLLLLPSGFAAKIRGILSLRSTAKTKPQRHAVCRMRQPRARCVQRIWGRRKHTSVPLRKSHAEKFSILIIIPQDHCHKIADKYVEFEFVIIFIDLLLLRLPVYRHLLFNRIPHHEWGIDVSIITHPLTESYLARRSSTA